MDLVDRIKTIDAMPKQIAIIETAIKTSAILEAAIFLFSNMLEYLISLSHLIQSNSDK